MTTEAKKRTTIIEKSTKPSKLTKRKTATKKKSSTKIKTTKRKTSKKRKPTKRKTTRRTRTITTKAPPVTINMPAPQAPQQAGVSKIMLENFVALQRVLTNLSTKMDNLTTKLGSLLDLFEISAKSLADREFEIEKDNKETLEKLNILLDQNKILARGLSLMHERMPQENFPHPPIPDQQQRNYQQTQISNPKMGAQTAAQPQTKSTLTRELATSPPPFQQPPMPFGTPPQIPPAPKNDSISKPGLGPSSFNPKKTNSLQETNPPSTPTNNSPTKEPEIDDDFSDIPDPEDLDLDAPQTN